MKGLRYRFSICAANSDKFFCVSERRRSLIAVAAPRAPAGRWLVTIVSKGGRGTVGRVVAVSVSLTFSLCKVNTRPRVIIYNGAIARTPG